MAKRPAVVVPRPDGNVVTLLNLANGNRLVCPTRGDCRLWPAGAGDAGEMLDGIWLGDRPRVLLASPQAGLRYFSVP